MDLVVQACARCQFHLWFNLLVDEGNAKLHLWRFTFPHHWFHRFWLAYFAMISAQKSILAIHSDIVPVTEISLCHSTCLGMRVSASTWCKYDLGILFSLLQDEKNQFLIVNVWFRFVSSFSWISTQKRKKTWTRAECRKEILFSKFCNVLLYKIERLRCDSFHLLLSENCVDCCLDKKKIRKLFNVSFCVSLWFSSGGMSTWRGLRPSTTGWTGSTFCPPTSGNQTSSSTTGTFSIRTADATFAKGLLIYTSFMLKHFDTGDSNQGMRIRPVQRVIQWLRTKMFGSGFLLQEVRLHNSPRNRPNLIQGEWAWKRLK